MSDLSISMCSSSAVWFISVIPFSDKAGFNPKYLKNIKSVTVCSVIRNTEYALKKQWQSCFTSFLCIYHFGD